MFLDQQLLTPSWIKSHHYCSSNLYSHFKHQSTSKGTIKNWYNPINVIIFSLSHLIISSSLSSTRDNLRDFVLSCRYFHCLHLEMKAQNFSFTKPKNHKNIKKSVAGGAILNHSEKGSAKWPPGLLNTIIPSSAFCNHSTNFFIWSRKTLLPLATCASLYHFNIASSLSTSAAISNQTFQSYYMHIMF